MPLNPDRNHYSVAPVGNTIIIGRVALLKGGLSRENALNLIGWLVLSVNAKPEEISRVLSEASTPIGKQVLPPAAVVDPKVVPPVATFIGEIDAEEQAAIDAVVKEQTAMPPAVGTSAKTTVPKSPAAVDGDALAATWGKVST